MSIRGKTAIAGIGETPTDRLGSKPGEPRKSTAEYLAWAARLAMEDAGLTKKDFDSQGLAAIYTTNHSQPFGLKKWPRFLESRPAFRSPAATAARARFHCWDTPQRRSRPDFAISYWSSRPPRPSANTAAAAASLRTPATTKCHSA